MKRKVIQIAESTQLISIPRKWALRYNIKKGDDIDVEINGSKLIVSTEQDQKISKCTLDLSHAESIEKQSITAAYLKGYDEVEIKYVSSEQVQLIQQLLSELTGYDIVFQTKNSCTIKQISKPSPEEFSNIMNRVFLLILDTCKNITDGLKKNEKELLESVMFRDQTINKFSNFCLRLINKGRGVDSEVMTSTYFLINSLKRLGEEYSQLALKLLEKRQSDKKIVSFLESINEFYEAVYRAFTAKSLGRCSEATAQYEKIKKELQDPKMPSSGVYFNLRQILQIIKEIQEGTLVLLV